MPEAVREIAGVFFAVVLLGLALLQATKIRARESRVLATVLSLVSLGIITWLLSRHTVAALGTALQDISVAVLVIACGTWIYWKSRHSAAGTFDGRNS